VSEESGLNFVHHENKYVDFKHQRLLLCKLSEQGPLMSVDDVNGDGLSDLFIGGAIGQSGRLYLRKKDGSFSVASSQPWEKDKDAEDAGSVFFDAEGDGDKDLYVVSGGIEYAESSAQLEDRLYLNDGKGRFTKASSSLPSKKGSGSCVVASDFDRDGDLDLFVGGWVQSSSFPLHAASRLLRNDSDKKQQKITFTDVTPEMIRNAGIVTSAAWGDIDKDGWDDLIVVGHWMPITVFKNTSGKFSNITESLGLKQTGGLWNTIKAADVDGDQDLDYIVGNLGTNGELPADKETPLQLFYDDFDKNGAMDPIVCYYENGMVCPVPTRDDMISQVPSLKKKFLRYEAYAKATIHEVLTPEQLSNCKKLSVHTLRSVLLRNSDGKLSVEILPTEVQYAPVQGIVTGQFNDDQTMDLLLVGNFFGYRVEYGPFDAGIGSVLLGQPNGGYRVASGKESGVIVRGDVRDAVLLQDKDNGDLCVVSVNNSRTQVLRVAAQTRNH
jgi:hypothetical protein